MKTYHAESARAGLEAAAAAGLPWEDFCVAATDLLERAIPYDAVCVGIADPATSLMTGRVIHDLLIGDDARFMQLEYCVPDFNLFTDLARRPVAVGVLEEATGGDLQRSTRNREYLSVVGVEHELRGVVRSQGRMWGGYALYRTPGRTGFSPAEADFMHRLERTLSVGFRRGLIASTVEQALRSEPTETAVIVFDRAGEVTSATPSAQRRVEELGGELWSRLPMPVVGVVIAARSAVDGTGAHVPKVQLRSRTGEWLSLHAAPIRGRDGSTGEIALTIEAAGAFGVVPLIVAAYGLTDRERDVVRHVLAGDSTQQIAAGLHLSPYTVQDHLKVIFGKVGVTSRRELSAQIFFTQYAGRLGGAVGATGWFE
jgi:DNA-binding CsgD family transcriptional regulator